jgi:hypothetical protein
MKLNFITLSSAIATAVVAYPQSSNSGNLTSSTQPTNSNSGNNNSTIDNPPTQDGSKDRNNAGVVSLATAILMQTAVDAWQRDTGVVSNFVNQGASFTDEETFKNQALIAHSAEVDELTHKNVLDQFMPNNTNVQNANATLTNGK